MLGFPILYFKGRRLTMFQLSGFYCRGMNKNRQHKSLGFLIIFIVWVVVKISVPFWVPIIIRHLLFRVPKKGP